MQGLPAEWPEGNSAALNKHIGTAIDGIEGELCTEASLLLLRGSSGEGESSLPGCNYWKLGKLNLNAIHRGITTLRRPTSQKSETLIAF